MRTLETLPVSIDLPQFKIVEGHRKGTWYAVFNSAYEAFEFDLLCGWVFCGCPIVHFGQYENAFDITDMRRRPN